jgi:hypothetical protein
VMMQMKCASRSIESAVCFSITLRHEDRGEETLQEVNSSRVDETNGRIVDQAARFVLCHPDETR